jgi:hypothetical protein
MNRFIYLVSLELIFQGLDYFWSFIGSYFKDESPWKDCPKDLEFWHSVHEIVCSIILVFLLVVMSRINLRMLSPLTLLKFCVILQIFSFYWLIQGAVWIFDVMANDVDCVKYN